MAKSNKAGTALNVPTVEAFVATAGQSIVSLGAAEYNTGKLSEELKKANTTLTSANDATIALFVDNKWDADAMLVLPPTESGKGRKTLDKTNVEEAPYYWACVDMFAQGYTTPECNVAHLVRADNKELSELEVGLKKHFRGKIVQAISNLAKRIKNAKEKAEKGQGDVKRVTKTFAEKQIGQLKTMYKQAGNAEDVTGLKQDAGHYKTALAKLAKDFFGEDLDKLTK